MQIAFRKPAKFNEMLVITSEILKIGHGSFEFLQKISVDQQILTEAQVKIACLQAVNFKPTAIPEKIKLAMKKYDKAERI
jgi:acyl-CoA thioester hydrolase